MGIATEASSKDGGAGLYREARRGDSDSSRYAPSGLLEESGGMRPEGCHPQVPVVGDLRVLPDLARLSQKPLASLVYTQRHKS